MTVRRDLLLASGILSLGGISYYYLSNPNKTPAPLLLSKRQSLPTEYPPLSSEQVEKILLSKQTTFTPNGKGAQSILKCDFNSVASNHPIEDYHSESVTKNGGTIVSVFDGHGGTECASILSQYMSSYVADAVAKIPSSTPNRSQAVSEALQKAFVRLDNDILHGGFPSPSNQFSSYYFFRPKVDSSSILSNLRSALAGSCALVAYFEDNQVYVACTGDSRAVLGKKKSDGSFYAIEMTRDQTTKNPHEYSRLIEEHPGELNTVVQRGRVLGGLMPTRAFGNYLNFILNF